MSTASSFIIQGFSDEYQRENSEKLLNLRDFMILSGFCLQEPIGFRTNL